MRKTALARRYAKALIEIGREEGAFGRFGTELRSALAVFKGSPELAKVLMNPMYKVEERLGLMSALADKLGTSEPVKRFLAILVETRNVAIFDEICDAYFRMEDELSGRVRVTVATAADPDQAMLDDVKKKLKDETGKEIILSHEKDASLIGGIVIKIGNLLLDGSLRAQLSRMREKTLEGVG
jgi:F-type H+-transporting ATPase subunit delta